ncbi:MAG: glycosyltransferase family 4 protein [Dehalobacter sp. 4CP]|uniref:glycosyltransferase n=1 Tax=Dehalobacter sp. CP TaxID=2594474 RepID=UPI0013C70E16|nr:glycosyltransferase family 4 protein [Dehalobacter sp. 4CP]
MNIIYVSRLCSSRKFKDIFENAIIKPPQQAQKYHRLLVEGLARNDEIVVQAISSLPINRSMSKKILFKREIEEVEGIHYTYLPFANLPVLKQIIIFFSCFFRLWKIINKNRNSVIICDVLNISLAGAAVLVSRLSQITCVGIVTDVPFYLASMSEDTSRSKNRLISKINTYIMNKFDAYVFLTPYMNQLINKKNKRYVIIEGQVDANMVDYENELSSKYETNVCLYAGELNKKYGIKMLTDAFIAAQVENSELHIYGSGSFEHELQQICRQHRNIKYFGVVSNDIIIKEQTKATLLINPRPTNEEYTKFSFPSKNMEYMASGTAMLTTNLPGMPLEYRHYIYIFEDETVQGLAANIRTLLSNPKEELFYKGLEAKQFVLKNKNNIIQAGKIINMLKERK